MSSRIAIGIVVLAIAGAGIYFWPDAQEHTPPAGTAGPSKSAPAPSPRRATATAAATPFATTVPPGSSRSEQLLRWIHAVVDALEQRGDAESLATAAALLLQQERSTEGDVRIAALLARASDAAMNDATVQRIALVGCKMLLVGKTTCDARQYEQRLIAADPGNGVSWIEGLERANASRDVITQMATLSRMAGAERFDVYLASMSGLIGRAIERAPVPAPAISYGDGYATNPKVMGAISGAVLSTSDGALQAVTNVCSAQANSEIIVSCRKLAGLMRNSDALVYRLIGDAVALRFVTAGAPEERELRDEQRRLRWLHEQSRHVDPARIAASVERTGGEPQAIEEVLRLSGSPLTPPDDWQRDAN